MTDDKGTGEASFEVTFNLWRWTSERGGELGNLVVSKSGLLIEVEDDHYSGTLNAKQAQDLALCILKQHPLIEPVNVALGPPPAHGFIDWLEKVVTTFKPQHELSYWALLQQLEEIVRVGRGKPLPSAECLKCGGRLELVPLLSKLEHESRGSMLAASSQIVHVAPPCEAWKDGATMVDCLPPTTVFR